MPKIWMYYFTLYACWLVWSWVIITLNNILMLLNNVLGFFQSYPNIGKNYTSEYTKSLHTSTHLNCVLLNPSPRILMQHSLFLTQHIHLFLFNEAFCTFEHFKAYFFSHFVLLAFYNNLGKCHHCFFLMARNQKLPALSNGINKVNLVICIRIIVLLFIINLRKHIIPKIDLEFSCMAFLSLTTMYTVWNSFQCPYDFTVFWDVETPPHQKPLISSQLNCCDNDGFFGGGAQKKIFLY